MKVALIEPAMIKSNGFSEKPSWVLQPLTLATLAGLTPPDVEVQALDDRIEGINHRFFSALFNLLTPYPGADLYTEFLQQGRLLKSQWWLDASYTYGSVVLQPKSISPHELEQTRLRMYREFYGPHSILRRLWDPTANARDLWHAFTFLTMN